ncbi:MAG: hypothetical protein GY769_07520 [bacterium]|nr:hypothetical protein [bacterium]
MIIVEILGASVVELTVVGAWLLPVHDYKVATVPSTTRAREPTGKFNVYNTAHDIY